MVSVCSNPAHNENSEENLITTEYAHAYDPCEDESLAFEALKLTHFAAKIINTVHENVHVWLKYILSASYKLC